MIFDQFQRYQTISRLLDEIRMKEKFCKLNILEVGANSQKTLGKFTSDDIFYTDLQVPEGFENDPDFFVADATNLKEIEDNSYDVVVASDVYEHIPEEKRSAFINEIHRVSRLAVILCFPIGSPEVEAAEKKVNEIYKRMFGEDHRWLIEHIINGLPRLNEFEKMLTQSQIKYTGFQHGGLSNWISLQFTQLCLWDMSGLPQADILDNIYNGKYYYQDTDSENYRVFYMLCKGINVNEYDKVCKGLFKDQGNHNNLKEECNRLAIEGIYKKVGETNHLVSQLLDIVAKQNKVIEDLRNEIFNGRGV